ncbi:MAG: hypothetical protein GX447_02920 [Elusimicrobia bacterium]|nr:hypothetical protein [Elusimicrobiota bacterium]
MLKKIYDNKYYFFIFVYFFISFFLFSCSPDTAFICSTEILPSEEADRPYSNDRIYLNIEKPQIEAELPPDMDRENISGLIESAFKRELSYLEIDLPDYRKNFTLTACFKKAKFGKIEGKIFPEYAELEVGLYEDGNILFKKTYSASADNILPENQYRKIISKLFFDIRQDIKNSIVEKTND